MDFKDILRIFHLRSPSLAQDLVSGLSSLGHTIASQVGKASSSLLPIHRFHPDLLILEHQDLATTLREISTLQKEFPSLPLVILDSGSEVHYTDLLELLPQCSYLHSSFSPEVTELILRKALASHAYSHSLLKTQRYLDTLLDTLKSGLLILNAEGAIEWLNQSAADLLATPARLAVGTPMALLTQFEDAECKPVGFHQISSEFTLLTQQNRNAVSFPVRVRSHAIKDAYGLIVGVGILIQKYQLEASRSSFEPQFLIQELPTSSPFWCTDLKGNVLAENTSATELRSEVTDSSSIAAFFQAADLQNLEQHLESTTKQGYSATPLHSTKKASAPLYFHSLSLPSFLLHWISEIHTTDLDSDEKRKLEKLDSLGLLARGFAHDFNNLLTVLSGHLSLGQQKLTQRGDKIPELETAQMATQEAQSLVQQLLTFASGGTPIKKVLPLHRFLQEFLTQHPRKDQIAYFLNLAQPEIEMEMDPHQIKRVLSNLLKNAEQALANRPGMITLSCRLKKSPTPLHDSPQSSHAQVEAEIQIRDTGEGISPDALLKVFEPYYSTRQAMNATGLGLTVCESIVKAHGGHIKLTSYLGEETVVTVTLPTKVSNVVPHASPEVIPPNLQRTAVAPASQTRDSRKRILLLDDEPGIRNLVRLSLPSSSYTLDETEEGLQTIRNYNLALLENQKYDIVILDLSIPHGMGGLQVMAALREIDPQVKAIVSSGYSDDTAMSHPEKYGFIDVLPKPYLPKDLLQILRKHLGE